MHFWGAKMAVFGPSILAFQFWNPHRHLLCIVFLVRHGTKWDKKANIYQKWPKRPTPVPSLTTTTIIATMMMMKKSFCSRPLDPFSHVLQGGRPDSSFILITTTNIIDRTLITIFLLIFLIAATDIIPILLILISRCTGWNSIRLLVAAAKWKISARWNGEKAEKKEIELREQMWGETDKTEHKS